MRFPRIVLFSAALLTACQTDTRHLPDTSPLKPVPVGSTLELHQELTIPADKVAVYLQGGRVMPFSSVWAVNPHCKFEVYRRLDAEQTVKPDIFHITHVYQGEAHSVSLDRLQLAAGGVGIHLQFGIGGSSSPSSRAIVTVMTLHSPRQPHVFRLSCGHVDDPGSDQLSIAQVRKVLGEVFTLRTNESAR
jgi:hypothetical protein